MLRIDTSGDIAFMKYVLAFLDWPDMQLPRDTMREHVAMVNAKHAITETAVCSCPQPAATFVFFDKFHKSLAHRACRALGPAAIRAISVSALLSEFFLTCRTRARGSEMSLAEAFTGTVFCIGMLGIYVEWLLALKAITDYCCASHVGNQSFLTVVRAA